MVELKLAANKEKMSRAYNKRVKLRPMQVGDLVLRRTAATGKRQSRGKVHGQLGRAIPVHE